MKIALLLLTIDNPYFINNLKKFISNDVLLFIHPKFKNKIHKSLQKYIIKDIIYTNWGKFDIVDATINLLQSSFNKCDYFYLISGDTFILKKPEIFDYSCFDFIKKYNEIYKTSQWFGLNKKDAKIIIDTRHKYKNYFSKLKLDGAPDENYFLTILNKEIKNYQYIIKKLMFVKWTNNVISKHPIIFNKLTNNDMIFLKYSFFIRKCLPSFKFQIVNTQNLLHVFYIGTNTNQQNILNFDLINIDFVIISSIDLNLINNKILQNSFYIIPIIWKFFENTISSLKNDVLFSPWKKFIFYNENVSSL